MSLISKQIDELRGYAKGRKGELAKLINDAAFTIELLSAKQPEPQWIPCSERLPERNLVVLVTTRWGEVTEGVKLSGNAWFIGRGEENAFDSDIIAWMPKPEPYKEGGEDSNDDGALDEFDTEDTLRKFPSAQPEIVRCKDCKEYDQRQTVNELRTEGSEKT